LDTSLSDISFLAKCPFLLNHIKGYWARRQLLSAPPSDLSRQGREVLLLPLDGGGWVGVLIDE